jgi:hypothetical protein
MPPRPQLNEEKSGRWQRDHYGAAQSQNDPSGRLMHHEHASLHGQLGLQITFAINKGLNLILQRHYVGYANITPPTLLQGSDDTMVVWGILDAA